MKSVGFYRDHHIITNPAWIRNGIGCDHNSEGTLRTYRSSTYENRIDWPNNHTDACSSGVFRSAKSTKFKRRESYADDFGQIKWNTNHIGDGCRHTYANDKYHTPTWSRFLSDRDVTSHPYRARPGSGEARWQRSRQGQWQSSWQDGNIVSDRYKWRRCASADISLRFGSVPKTCLWFKEGLNDPHDNRSSVQSALRSRSCNARHDISGFSRYPTLRNIPRLTTNQSSSFLRRRHLNVFREDRLRPVFRRPDAFYTEKHQEYSYTLSTQQNCSSILNQDVENTNASSYYTQVNDPLTKRRPSAYMTCVDTGKTVSYRSSNRNKSKRYTDNSWTNRSLKADYHFIESRLQNDLPVSTKAKPLIGNDNDVHRAVFGPDELRDKEMDTHQSLDNNRQVYPHATGAQTDRQKAIVDNDEGVTGTGENSQICKTASHTRSDRPAKVSGPNSSANIEKTGKHLPNWRQTKDFEISNKNISYSQLQFDSNARHSTNKFDLSMTRTGFKVKVSSKDQGLENSKNDKRSIYHSVSDRNVLDISTKIADKHVTSKKREGRPMNDKYRIHKDDLQSFDFEKRILTEGKLKRHQEEPTPLSNEIRKQSSCRAWTVKSHQSGSSAPFMYTKSQPNYKNNLMLLQKRREKALGEAQRGKDEVFFPLSGNEQEQRSSQVVGKKVSSRGNHVFGSGSSSTQAIGRIDLEDLGQPVQLGDNVTDTAFPNKHSQMRAENEPTTLDAVKSKTEYGGSSLPYQELLSDTLQWLRNSSLHDMEDSLLQHLERVTNKHKVTPKFNIPNRKGLYYPQEAYISQCDSAEDFPCCQVCNKSSQKCSCLQQSCTECGLSYPAGTVKKMNSNGRSIRKPTSQSSLHHICGKDKSETLRCDQDRHETAEGSNYASKNLRQSTQTQSVAKDLENKNIYKNNQPQDGDTKTKLDMCDGSKSPFNVEQRLEQPWACAADENNPCNGLKHLQEDLAGKDKAVHIENRSETSCNRNIVDNERASENEKHSNKVHAEQEEDNYERQDNTFEDAIEKTKASLFKNDRKLSKKTSEEKQTQRKSTVLKSKSNTRSKASLKKSGRRESVSTQTRINTTDDYSFSPLIEIKEDELLSPVEPPPPVAESNVMVDTDEIREKGLDTVDHEENCELGWEEDDVYVARCETDVDRPSAPVTCARCPDARSVVGSPVDPPPPPPKVIELERESSLALVIPANPSKVEAPTDHSRKRRRSSRKIKRESFDVRKSFNPRRRSSAKQDQMKQYLSSLGETLGSGLQESPSKLRRNLSSTSKSNIPKRLTQTISGTAANVFRRSTRQSSTLEILKSSPYTTKKYSSEDNTLESDNTYKQKNVLIKTRPSATKQKQTEYEFTRKFPNPKKDEKLKKLNDEDKMQTSSEKNKPRPLSSGYNPERGMKRPKKQQIVRDYNALQREKLRGHGAVFVCPSKLDIKLKRMTVKKRTRFESDLKLERMKTKRDLDKTYAFRLTQGPLVRAVENILRKQGPAPGNNLRDIIAANLGGSRKS